MNCYEVSWRAGDARRDWDGGRVAGRCIGGRHNHTAPEKALVAIGFVMFLPVVEARSTTTDMNYTNTMTSINMISYQIPTHPQKEEASSSPDGACGAVTASSGFRWIVMA